MRIDSELESLLAFAADHHNAIHSNEAEGLGVPVHRLRRARQAGIVANVGPRVWSFVSLPGGPAQALRAATLALRDGAATCRSAAWLHGWIEAPPEPEVWVREGSRNLRQRVSIHRTGFIDPANDISEVDNIRTLNRAATLVVLGLVAPVPVVARCLDDFTRTDSMQWLEETLARAIEANARGRSALIKVLEDPRRIAGVTDSWMERVLSSLLAHPELPPLELQHRLVVDGQRYRIDIACPELRLGIEAHSRTYHWGPDKADADNVRDLALAAAGWQILYVTWSQIRQPAELERRFLQAARARARYAGRHAHPA